jgi:hypothetical protein
VEDYPALFPGSVGGRSSNFYILKEIEVFIPKGFANVFRSHFPRRAAFFFRTIEWKDKGNKIATSCKISMDHPSPVVTPFWRDGTEKSMVENEVKWAFIKGKSISDFKFSADIFDGWLKLWFEGFHHVHGEYFPAPLCKRKSIPATATSRH